jgi:hypothetical protein
MIFRNAHRIFTLLVCCFAPLTASALECPHKLLWTNGVLWCYSTVTCDSPIQCGNPTNVALIYNHAVTDLGCKAIPPNCECNLPDGSNDYLFRVVVETRGQLSVYEMDPDLPVNAPNCSFMDVFSVPIPNTADFYQCMEFRFTPGPGQPPQNIRIAIKLKSKPSSYLVNETITLTATHLIRNVNGQDIKYQLLNNGRLMPEETPVPRPAGEPNATGQDETTPPVPDAAGETAK